MRNAMKVAKWEIKRNLKNKSFLIGLFLTPVLFFGFAFLGSLFGGSDDEKAETVDVFVHDELGVYPTLQKAVESSDLNWELEKTDVEKGAVKEKLKSNGNTAYIFLNESALKSGTIPVYTSEEIPSSFMNQVRILTAPIKTMQMKQLGLTSEQLAAVSKNFAFKQLAADEITASGEAKPEEKSEGLGEDFFKRAIPGLFAGVMLFSIVVSGMYIFQSASQEKKDKIAKLSCLP